MKLFSVGPAWIVSFIMLGLLAPCLRAADISNSTLKTIHQRKSVRHYLDRSVSPSQLETLMKAGMAAPTAADKRPWAFVAITDRARLNELAQGMRFGKMLEKAGAAIVVCGLPSKSLPGAESQYWIQDCSAATENILLAAESIGLGAVWLGAHPMDDRVRHIQKILHLPDGVVPLNVISIGYPDGSEKPKNKYDPANIHWNQW